MTEEEIKERYQKVCICRSISKGTIIDIVKNGAKTLEDVRRKSGATTGSCKGDRCKAKILDILRRYA
ncbi:MAG: (2Fe-2S)-binding protein [Spirochaetales bacterium]|nr:(2Fe-2S)-binding protein [Spirochaetales bacterium]